MATVYSDALYDITKLGVVSSSYFTLSADANEVTLLSAGALGSSQVIGIGFNEADVDTATALGARSNVTISPFSSGVATGEAPTTLTIGVSAAAGIPIGLLLANGKGVNLTLVGGTYTYAADVSATTYDISDKNDRRLHLLGFH